MDRRPGMKFRSAFNRKSKTCGEQRRTIQNRKLVGLFALVVAFVLCGAVARRSSRRKSDG